MATDQGRTSNLNGLQLVSDIENKVVPQVGHTTFRPPFSPVSIGAIVGREIGKHSKPTRKSPMHYWHEKNNAVFVDAGVWLRPRYYKQGSENLFEASKREAKKCMFFHPFLRPFRRCEIGVNFTNNNHPIDHANRGKGSWMGDWFEGGCNVAWDHCSGGTRLQVGYPYRGSVVFSYGT